MERPATGKRGTNLQLGFGGALGIAGAIALF
jgi:hypothetical protein